MQALEICSEKVEVWSENVQCNSRRAWLSCKGLPPFAWNHSTFQSIAKKWVLLLIRIWCCSGELADAVKGTMYGMGNGGVNPGKLGYYRTNSLDVHSDRDLK